MSAIVAAYDELELARRNNEGNITIEELATLHDVVVERVTWSGKENSLHVYALVQEGRPEHFFASGTECKETFIRCVQEASWDKLIARIVEHEQQQERAKAFADAGESNSLNS